MWRSWRKNRKQCSRSHFNRESGDTNETISQNIRTASASFAENDPVAICGICARFVQVWRLEQWSTIIYYN
ncbi:hypothetical protein IEQ34_020302 [Dendrobium chrysotoxum]|uniref:Uncharacterized protein n=1 Tax=Dendrobium chrysotoxum TaxID=161865 RepID=A0AAV7FKG9_DENCH|nr:hypothetical protein IEQ34_020302 [Dendrobium chrysotoxum]